MAQAAFKAGLISTDHVKVFGECLARRFEPAFTEWEPTLVEWAVEMDWDSFIKAVGAWKDAADQTLPDETDESDEAARGLWLSKTLNGRGELKGTLTPTGRAIFGGELERLEQQLFKADWKAAETEFGKGNVTINQLWRSPSKRRADALILMAERSAAAGSPSKPKPTVHVRMTLADLNFGLRRLAGPDATPVDPTMSMCELDDGTRISHKTAIRLLIDAHVTRVVFGPDGEILDLGRNERWFSDAQKTAMVNRDLYCRCGCGKPARNCQADHIIEWQHYGVTNIGNSQTLCPRSHIAKTNTGISPPGPNRQPSPGGPHQQHKGRGRHQNPTGGT